VAEVASAYVSLMPSFRGGAAAISKEIDGPISKAGQDGGKRFGGGMAAGIGGMARSIFAPLAAAAAGVSLVGFFKDAIGGASDLQESTTKIAAIFGDASAAVQDFAGQGAKTLGQTRLDVLNASATFGTFGKAAGLAGNDLAGFSTGFAALSTDLASFYNTSPEEAVEAIGAALRGEAEPIRKYGVLLDDATLRQEALALGLVKTTKDALTPQQRVLAAQSAIYKQTADAQGDFSRTSGGLANQQRILSAQFSDLRSGIGEKLLPVITSVVSFLNANLVPTFDKVGAAVKSVFDLVVKGDFTSAFREAFNVDEDSGVVSFLLGLRDTAITVFGEIRGGVNAFVAAFKEGGSDVTSSGLAGAFERVGLAARGLANFVTGTLIPGIASLVGWLRDNQSWLMPIAVGVGAIVVAFQAYQAVMTIARTVTAAYAVVQGVLNAVMAANPIGLVVLAIVGLVAALVYAWHNSETFRNVVTGVWEAVKGAVLAVASWFTDTLVPWLQGAWDAVVTGVQAVGQWFADVWNSISSATTAVWTAITSFISSIPQRILSFFLNWTLPGLLIQHWDSIKQGAITGFNAVVDFVRGIPQRIVDGLGALGRLLYTAGQDLLNGLINGIRDKVSGAVEAVKDAVSGVIDGAKDLLGINSPSKVFMEIGAYTGEGFALGIQSQKRAAQGAMANLVAAPSVPRMNSNLAGVAGATNGPPLRSGPLVHQDIHPVPGMTETQVGDMAGRGAARALIGVGL
jgi:hypothetical protein